MVASCLADTQVHPYKENCLNRISPVQRRKIIHCLKKRLFGSMGHLVISAIFHRLRCNHRLADLVLIVLVMVQPFAFGSWAAGGRRIQPAAHWV
jgi:hypothetical protein